MKLFRKYVKGMKANHGYLTAQQAGTMMTGFTIALIIIYVNQL